MTPGQGQGTGRARETVTVDGTVVSKGSVVRLWPRADADIFDLALRGLTATVDAVEEDYEGNTHLAVVLTHDPGRDLSARIGQRFFFTPAEVEPLAAETAAATGRVLVAGIGNIFLGDDGFGVEVVNALAGRHLPEGVEAVDFGIRGMDLSYALGNGYRAAILVDAAPRGLPPGTVSLIEPELDAAPPSLDGHRLDPVNALRQARHTGPMPERVLLVVCEPAERMRGDEPDIVMELSPPVRSAVDEAVAMVLEVLDELDAGHPGGGPPGPDEPGKGEKTRQGR